MHLLKLLPFIYAYLLSAVQSPSVNAIHPQALSRQTTILNKPSPQKPPLPLHSNQLSSRDSPTDICATIDLGPLAELEPLGFRLPQRVSTSSHYCLCLNSLDYSLDTNPDLASLATLFGRETIVTYLQILIKTSTRKQECAEVPHVYSIRGDFDLSQKDSRNTTMSTTSVTQIEDSCACTGSLPFYDRACGRLTKGYPALVSCVSKGQEFLCRYADDATCQVTETACGHPGNENVPAFSRADVKTTVKNCGGYLHSLATVQPSTSMGVDCYRIVHIVKVKFVGRECIITSCAHRWIPSAGGEVCIQQQRAKTLRMRRAKGRDSNTDRVTLDIHVVIDLAQLLRSLNDLRFHSKYLHNGSNKELSVTLIAVDDIFQAATQILFSHTLGSFLAYTEKLLNAVGRADDMLRDCNISENQEFDQIRAHVEIIIALTTDILDWYRALYGEIGSRDTISLEVPITISLNRLLNHLGLGDLKTVVKLGEFGSEVMGTTNGLVDDPTIIRPDDERRRQLGSDSRIDWLVAQVEKLVGLVLQLEDLDSFHSLKISDSINISALTPVSLATLGLITSVRISELSRSIDLLDLASTDALMVLSSCGDCETVLDKLSLIIEAAMATRDLCEEFLPHDEIALPFPIPIPEPVSPHALARVPSKHTSTASMARRSKGAPVVIVLDGLLRNMGIGGVRANISVGGLDGRVSGMLNGVVSLLNAGGRRSVRREGIKSSMAIFVDSELAKAFTTAVESVMDLESMSAGSGPLATLLAGAMPPVLASLQTVLVSPTVTGLISAIDELVGATKTMDKMLTDCNCTNSSVLESSGRFVAAVENVRKWIDEHPNIAKKEEIRT